MFIPLCRLFRLNCMKHLASKHAKENWMSHVITGFCQIKNIASGRPLINFNLKTDGLAVFFLEY